MGTAAVYFDPTQPEQAAHLIASHLNNTEPMITAGLENVKRFTTENMVNGYLAAYRLVLEQTKENSRLSSQKQL